MKDIKVMDRLIISFILFLVFFFRYIQVLYPFWYYLGLFLVGYILICMYQSRFRMRPWLLVSTLFLIVIILINIYYFGVGNVFIENFFMVFTPLTLIMYVGFLLHRYSFEVLFESGRKLIIFLNIYFWINAAIITIQYLTGSFMMTRFLSWGSYAFDHMTGLMGPFATGILNVFWISLLIMNLIYHLITKEKKWLITLLTMIPTMVILSHFNENKAFLPSALLFLIIFLMYFLFSKKCTYKRIIQTILILLSITLISLYAYNSSETIQQQVNKIIELASDFTSNGKPTTHNERAYLNWAAFNLYNASEFGLGINSVDFESQTIHKNFGINSMSLLLIHGGIYYLIAIVNISAILVTSGIKQKANPSTFILFLIFLSYFSVFSLLTQPYRDNYVMVMIAILMAFIGIYEKYQNNLKPEER